MSDESYSTLAFEVEDGIAVLALNRPKARNAIDDTMRDELARMVDRLGADRSVRGLVLTGAGDVFCSGGDVRGMLARVEQGARAGELGWWRQKEFHETLVKLYYLGMPTVAAVNGPAVGLGLDMALTCDFVFLAERATVASSFVKRGLVSDGGGFFHMPRRLGVAKSKELMFSGRTIDAGEALAIGLADRVMPADELIPAAKALLRGFAANPATAQAMAKSILNRAMELSFEQVNTLASQAQAFCYSSADHQASVRAFIAEREAARARKGA